MDPGWGAGEDICILKKIKGRQSPNSIGNGNQLLPHLQLSLRERNANGPRLGCRGRYIFKKNKGTLESKFLWKRKPTSAPPLTFVGNANGPPPVLSAVGN
jgi:hypothetical protein